MDEIKVFSKNDTIICKGVAILMMLFHHLYTSLDRFEDYDVDFKPFTQDSVVNVANFLKICVGIYVFISAYGLTLAYDKGKSLGETNSEFVLTRYIKTMFLYWFVYIVFTVFTINVDSYNIFKCYGGDGKIAAFWRMLIDFLGIADLTGSVTFNGTWWYMSLAILLIFCIPLLIGLYDKLGGGSITRIVFSSSCILRV